MKNITIPLFTIAIAMLGFFMSCSKDETNASDAKEYYTEEQKAALKVLNGTFTEDLYGVITTYSFTEQYNSFKEAECYGYTGSTKTEFVVHGKCLLTYWNGSQYSLYYFLNEKADNIAFYSEEIHAKAYELKIVSSTEFRLRQNNEPIWSKFTK